MPEDDAARYLIQRPNGQDGPYSLADLRQLADAGRLQPDDRLLNAIDRSSTSAAQVLPGLVATDRQPRVRRSRTSDRLAAQSAEARPKAQRTPLPLPATTAPGDTAMQPDADGSAAKRAPAWAIVMLVAAVLFVVVSIASVVISAMREQPAPVQADGRWTLATLPQRGGPWTIEVLPAEIVIRAPDGGMRSSGWSLHARDAQRCILRLERPHPVLGERLVFTTRDGKPAMMIADSTVPAEHIPPL